MKDPSTCPLNQYAQNLAHTLPGLADQRQTGRRGLYQGDAVSLCHSNELREVVEGFDLIPSKIKGLQSLRGIWH